jgi:hypothetical protein
VFYREMPKERGDTNRRGECLAGRVWTARKKNPEDKVSV